MIEIRLYNTLLHQEWNRFVHESKNATFLHLREYMDYHSDRFTDSSLMAYNDGKLLAILPANRVDSTLYSHQGLTYGGWLMPLKHFNVTNMLAVWEAMKEFLPSIGINSLIYKPSPHIYHKYPAEEDLYAIFRHNGSIIETNVASSIPLDNALDFNYTYRKAVNTARNNNILITEEQQCNRYWHLLSSLLQEKYDTNPVHSLSEISLLKERFPENIRLFTASVDGRILAGVLVYCTHTVAHAQYIASNEEGRSKGALPLLFKHLISTVFADMKHFDLGTSNENHGLYLNEGLILQKSHLGGRAIVYNTYKIDF